MDGGGASFRFGPAAPSDLERLTALRIAAMRPALERIGRFDPDRARRRLADEYQPEHTRLIWVGDGLAGCVAYAPDGPRRRLVRHFYLDPARQGRGLGSAVMAALMAEADAAGETAVLTVVRESLANAFYMRFGFVETGRDEIDIFYARAPRAEG